jgi:hypothetical protein
MRNELRGRVEQDYWVYGLDCSDYEYTIQLAMKLKAARLELLQQETIRIRERSPEDANDILDDIAYYTHVENDYIWHFCLWRLQAIFEGIIIHKLLSSSTERLPGLKAKLDAIKEAGFPLDDEDYEELLDWAKLRNALSHAPPEQYRPGPLQETDVLEFKTLVHNLSNRWIGMLSKHT